MAETYSVLGQSNPLAASLTAAYTVPVLTQSVISTITVCNRSAVATAFRISIAIAGAADSLPQYIAYDVPILGNETKSFTIGATLSAGDVVRVYATLATLSFNIFGTKLT